MRYFILFLLSPVLSFAITSHSIAYKTCVNQFLEKGIEFQKFVTDLDYSLPPTNGGDLLRAEKVARGDRSAVKALLGNPTLEIFEKTFYAMAHLVRQNEVPFETLVTLNLLWQFLKDHGPIDQIEFFPLFNPLGVTEDASLLAPVWAPATDTVDPIQLLKTFSNQAFGGGRGSRDDLFKLNERYETVDIGSFNNLFFKIPVRGGMQKHIANGMLALELTPFNALPVSVDQATRLTRAFQDPTFAVKINFASYPILQLLLSNLFRENTIKLLPWLGKASSQQIVDQIGVNKRLIGMVVPGIPKYYSAKDGNNNDVLTSIFSIHDYLHAIEGGFVPKPFRLAFSRFLEIFTEYPDLTETSNTLADDLADYRIFVHSFLETKMQARYLSLIRSNPYNPELIAICIAHMKNREHREILLGDLVKNPDYYEKLGWGVKEVLKLLPQHLLVPKVD